MKQLAYFAVSLILVIHASVSPDVLAQNAAVAEKPVDQAVEPRGNETPGVGPVRTEDWFQKLWRDRRATFAKRKADDQHSVVFLGDSITQGWSDDFRGKFPNLKVANRGISGD